MSTGAMEARAALRAIVGPDVGPLDRYFAQDPADRRAGLNVTSSEWEYEGVSRRRFEAFLARLRRYDIADQGTLDERLGRLNKAQLDDLLVVLGETPE